MTFQEIIFALQKFWGSHGCVLGNPYDIEKGAGTFNPNTFLMSLGPEPWNVAYVEPSRRPKDGSGISTSPISSDYETVSYQHSRIVSRKFTCFRN